MSKVLKNYYNPSRAPTKDEIEEYAKMIGLDLPADNDLLYIAMEGINAPLPPNWEVCEDEEGNLYHFNFSSGETLWDHPLEDKFRAAVQEQKQRKTSEEKTVKCIG